MEPDGQFADELRMVDAALQALKAVLSGASLEIAEAPLLNRKREILLKMAAAQDAGADQGAVVQAKKLDEPADDSIRPGTPPEIESLPAAQTVVASIPVHTPQPRAVLEGSAAFSTYLNTLIMDHQTMILLGLRSATGSMRIDVESIYVSLGVRDQTPVGTLLRPHLDHPDGGIDRSQVTISTALRRYPHLVVFGGPGSGKTTVLTYLLLTCARARQGETDLIRQRLQLEMPNPLPVWIDLPDFSQFVNIQMLSGAQDSSDLVLDYLQGLWAGRDMLFARTFFEPALVAGQAVFFLDGLSDIADRSQRMRVEQVLVDLAKKYPQCRIIISSRPTTITPGSLLSVNFGQVSLQGLSRMEIRRALHTWMDVIEHHTAGINSREMLARADKFAEELIQAIEANPGLLIHLGNPQLLYLAIVIHRQQLRLPLSRAGFFLSTFELFTQLLPRAGSLEMEWDIDTRRKVLMTLAQQLQTLGLREINAQEAHQLLAQFIDRGGDPSFHLQFDRFMVLEADYSGLFIESSPGKFRFVHGVYQEFLAALAATRGIASLRYSLTHLEDPWWREVLLFQADLYGAQSPTQFQSYLRAVLDLPVPQKYDRSQLFLLAAECLEVAGVQDALAPLAAEVVRKLQPVVDTPSTRDNLPTLKRKLAAVHAQERLRKTPAAPRLWKPPWGEPEWTRVSAGSFWMGSESPAAHASERLLHKVDLAEFHISRIPITNQQYSLYLIDTRAAPPDDWIDPYPPHGREGHPVVNVSWHEALEYCRWMSEKTRQNITLPSEAEWEKAARGDRDQREYPWGSTWEDLHCNSAELELDDTVPVGFFTEGASPYHCLDMAGNVWEWTRSLVVNYPYIVSPDRELLEGDQTRILRGGAFDHPAQLVRCTCRNTSGPHNRARNIGFRVISVSSAPTSQLKVDTKQNWQNRGSLLSRTRS